MTAQPIPPQLRRTHPHSLAKPLIHLTVMPARAGIQRLGLCEAQS